MSKKKTLDRDAWLRRALEVLPEEGVQGVRVERLARELGITKGSFYWHFNDLDDLRRSMLALWSEQYNEVIFDNPQFLEAAPAEGLLAAMTMVWKEGLDTYELAIRAWADHDWEADKMVREVYNSRMVFVRRFFTRLGFRGTEAEVRTRLTLCYLSWEPNMYPNQSEPRRLSLLKLQCELLTRN